MYHCGKMPRILRNFINLQTNKQIVMSLTTQKSKTLSLVASIILFSNLWINAQTQAEVLPVEKFEKVLLDGKEAYLNKENNKIINRAEYKKIANADAVLDSSSVAVISLDFWDTLKVNPYQDIKLSRPFAINFDELDYVSPIEGKIVITSRFGRRRRGPHRGIDIDLVTGDNVRSILSGKVRFVGYSSGHGKTVIVRHANEIETVYAHLSEYEVSTNDVIEKGQILGKGGATGNARGSHLHMEIRYKGICIHPESLLDFYDDPIIRAEELWVTNGMINPLNHSSYQRSSFETLESEEEAIVYQKNERKVYVVRKGDTLSEIAYKNNMRVRDIIAMNKVRYNSTLRIGQHLVISP